VIRSFHFFEELCIKQKKFQFQKSTFKKIFQNVVRRTQNLLLGQFLFQIDMKMDLNEVGGVGSKTNFMWYVATHTK